MDMKKRSCSVRPFDKGSFLTLHELEEYIKPAKEKMRCLYSALFDSAQKQEEAEKAEKANALLYKNLMVEASSGIKALEQFTLLVNLDKANIISQYICPEQINQCVNPLLRSALKIPRAMQALKKLLTSLELAELQPAVVALLTNNREQKHAAAIRKLLKNEIYKEYDRGQKIKKRFYAEICKKKGEPVQASLALPEECINAIKAMSRRKGIPNKSIQILEHRLQRQQLDKRSRAIEANLKSLKYEICKSQIRDQVGIQGRPKVNQSMEVGEEFLENKYKERCKENVKNLYLPDDLRVFRTIAGSRKQLPGPLNCLYFKYTNTRNNLPAVAPVRKNYSFALPKPILSAVPRIHLKHSIRSDINPVQSHKRNATRTICNSRDDSSSRNVIASNAPSFRRQKQLKPEEQAVA